MDKIQKVQIVEKKGSGLATAGMVLGIIAIVFAFIPLVNFISYICGGLALIFGLIATIKKAGGKGIVALVLGVLSLVIAITMNMAVFNAVKTAVNEVNNEQKANTSKWTQEIYDSITTAESSLSSDYSTVEYSGGTQYSEIETKVGAPSSTSSVDISGKESVTSSWTTLDFSGDGKSLNITITYDKDSGQITAKNKSEF